MKKSDFWFILLPSDILQHHVRCRSRRSDATRIVFLFFYAIFVGATICVFASSFFFSPPRHHNHRLVFNTLFASNQELLSVFGCAVVRYAFGCRAEPESVLTAVMPGRPSLSACLCVLDRWMMYYVKQSDPNNGLLSCLRTHTHTSTATQKDIHFHSHTHTHS